SFAWNIVAYAAFTAPTKWQPTRRMQAHRRDRLAHRAKRSGPAHDLCPAPFRAGPELRDHVTPCDSGCCLHSTTDSAVRTCGRISLLESLVCFANCANSRRDFSEHL